MPVPWHPLPSSLKPLQVYRHILREVSYLPPAFRKTIDSTVRKRFHNNRKDGPHTKKRLSKAMSSLRMLRAANSGDKDAMQNLLMKGFGRLGARRRELMSQLVLPQGPSDSKALEALLDQTSAPSTAVQTPADAPAGASTTTSGQSESTSENRSRKSKTWFYEKWDRDKLLQIIRSQKKQQEASKRSTSWPGQLVKNTDPNQHVPKTNVWGDPPAASLVSTKQATWWKRNAEKIMPPLGKGEWDLLRYLSQGGQNAGEWTIPARRPHALAESTSEAAGKIQWDWKAHAAAPVARVEQTRAMSQHLRTGLRDLGPYGGTLGRKELSSRWFRRAYNRTWQLTPKMEQDPNTLRYRLEWGQAVPNVPPATTLQMQFFEGVDAKGNLLPKKSDA